MSAPDPALTPNQLAAYNRDGFLVVGGRFGGDRLAALRVEARGARRPGEIRGSGPYI